MGTFAEDCAGSYQFTREAQDAYAIASLRHAKQAIAGGHFRAAIAPVTDSTGKAEAVVEIDEQPGKAKLDTIAR